MHSCFLLNLNGEVISHPFFYDLHVEDIPRFSIHISELVCIYTIYYIKIYTHLYYIYIYIYIYIYTQICSYAL